MKLHINNINNQIYFNNKTRIRQLISGNEIFPSRSVAEHACTILTENIYSSGSSSNKDTIFSMAGPKKNYLT